jgi:hypothetical protein
LCGLGYEKPVIHVYVLRVLLVEDVFEVLHGIYGSTLRRLGLWLWGSRLGFSVPGLDLYAMT